MATNWFLGVFQALGRQRELLQQAAAVYQQFGELHRRLRKEVVSGNAGAGLVVVEMNALGEVVSCSVDPELLKPEEREFLEGLVVEAVNAAYRKASEAQRQIMQEMVQQMDLSKFRPFLDGLFGVRPGPHPEDKPPEPPYPCDPWNPRG